MKSATIQEQAARRVFPAFDLATLLKSTFEPREGQRICILIDLPDPAQMKDFAFLKNPELPIQTNAVNFFHKPLHARVMKELGLQGGGIYAYKITGGSNLDLPDEAVTPEGTTVSLEKDIYPAHDIILCVSTYSATAPLTAFAKQYKFRGATLHGVNPTILRTGLSVSYDDVSRDAEKMRLGMTKADAVEIDFLYSGKTHTLRLELGQQEAQKSHGLCRGDEPDVANLPAGEIYFVPTGASGHFPMRYENGTIGLMHVANGRIQKAELLNGDPETIAAHNAKLTSDPVTGEDHLGGGLTPDKFAEHLNATHDDILFAPHKTSEIWVTQARMHRNGETKVLIENYEPSDYIVGLRK